jgi:hypothetical protein
LTGGTNEAGAAASNIRLLQLMAILLDFTIVTWGSNSFRLFDAGVTDRPSSSVLCHGLSLFSVSSQLRCNQPRLSAHTLTSLPHLGISHTVLPLDLQQYPQMSRVKPI